MLSLKSATELYLSQVIAGAVGFVSFVSGELMNHQNELGSSGGLSFTRTFRKASVLDSE